MPMDLPTTAPFQKLFSFFRILSHPSICGGGGGVVGEEVRAGEDLRPREPRGAGWAELVWPDGAPGWYHKITRKSLISNHSVSALGKFCSPPTLSLVAPLVHVGTWAGGCFVELRIGPRQVWFGFLLLHNILSPN